jgi:hypothetical protein
MNPIRSYMGPERRESHKKWIYIFWAVIFVAVIISTSSIVVADRATNTANRSEDGFCIAIQLIEGGALSDARIANAPGVSAEVKRIRTQQYRGSIHFATQLRQLGFHCQPPQKEVRILIKEVEREGVR